MNEPVGLYEKKKEAPVVVNLFESLDKVDSLVKIKSPRLGLGALAL